jgi:hypothetical protein
MNRLLLLLLVPVCFLHAEPTDPAPDFPEHHDGDEKNLLTNGSFDRGLEHWELIAFAHHGKMAIDTEVLHEGRPTLRIENGEADQSFVRQILRGKPMHARYRFTGYIKTQDVETEKPGGGAVLMVGITLEHTAPILKTTPWTKVTFDFTPSPKTPNEIRVGPSLGTYARAVTGTAWFADLSVVELHGGASR